jgi:hypothetical protein
MGDGSPSEAALTSQGDLPPRRPASLAACSPVSLQIPLEAAWAPGAISAAASVSGSISPRPQGCERSPRLQPVLRRDPRIIPFVQKCAGA